MANVFVCSCCGASVTVDDTPGWSRCPSKGDKGLGLHEWSYVGTTGGSSGSAENSGYAAPAGDPNWLEMAIAGTVMLAVAVPVAAFLVDATLMLLGVKGFYLTGFLIKVLTFLFL